MKLQETAAGRAVLENARYKYRAELVQPGDPEFGKLYGKEIRERQEARREQERVSRAMWEKSPNYVPRGTEQ